MRVERHNQFRRRDTCPYAEIDLIAAHHPAQKQIEPFACAPGRRTGKEVAHTRTPWLTTVRAAHIQRKRSRGKAVERRADIVLLAEHFLARACADYGLPAKTLEADARQALLDYPWPGNVRELSNVMERVVLLTESPAVTANMLALIEAASGGREGAGGEGQERSLGHLMEDIEQARILEVLRQTESRLADYWNRQYFYGVLPPATLASTGAVRRYVASDPNAIGYVPASEVDGSVRVVLHLQ